MTSQQPGGELFAAPHSDSARIVDFHDMSAAVRAQHAPVPASIAADADLCNVIPFRRRRSNDNAKDSAPALALTSGGRPAPVAVATDSRLKIASFAAISMLVHAGLFAAFWRDPVPLASIGMEVISVEIVVGATAPAGVAVNPGENETQAAAQIKEPTPEEQAVEPDSKAAEAPREVDQRETAPAETRVAEITPEERKPVERAVAETKVEMTPQAPEPEKPVVDPPAPNVMSVAVAVPDDTVARPAEPKPTGIKPEIKPAPTARKPAPKKEQAKVRDQERRKVAARGKDEDTAKRSSPASAPSTAANNIGRGRSDADSNYPGLVSAHLRRHQQYPSDARSRGDQGTATVSFSLDGGGRVMSVRLARGSGIASFDQEVQAMVRRASPFPAPPSGQSKSFTVPVNFRLN